MTELAVPGPPAPAPDAGPLELLDLAERLLEHHDEQERPEDAARSWHRCHEVLLRARDALEERGAGADPYELARARFLLGLTLSVGYWQSASGEADTYGIEHPGEVRRTAVGMLALSRATLPQDDPAYATACVRLGLLLHDRYEDDTAPDTDHADARDDDLDEDDTAPDTDRADARDDDLDEAVAAFDEGLALLEDEPHPGLFISFGCALGDRYARDRDPDDLRAGARVLMSVLDEVRPPGWEPAADGAGSGVDEADQLEIEARVRLIQLLQDSDRPEDTELACHHLELLAATAPYEHGSRLFAAAHLIDLYRERGGGRARPEDLPAYVDRLRDLHRLLDPGEPEHAQVAVLLGRALAEQSELGGHVRVALGEEAAGLLREALGRLAQDDELRPSAHAVLGCLLNVLREREPERYDGQEAVHHLEEATARYPADDPMRSDLLNQLAHATLAKDRFTIDPERADRTIALLNESLNVPSSTPGFDSQLHGAYAAALSQRHALSNSADDLDASIRHLTAAFRQTPVDDVNRVVYLQNLAVGLYQRYLSCGDLQDLETAHRYLREVAAVLNGGDAGAVLDLHVVEMDRPHLEQGLAQLQFMIALNSRSGPGMAAAVESMRRLRDTLAPEHPRRIPVDADFGLMLLMHSFHDGSTKDRMDALVLMAETVDAIPEGHSDRPKLLLRTAGALLMTSFSPYNARAVESAETMLRDLAAAVSPHSQEGLRGSALQATLLYNRFRHGGVPADVEQAVEIARAARERLADQAPSPMGTLITNLLADALRARAAPGDAVEGRRTGIAGLREAATVVLLQAAAEPALSVARTAADRALQIARWCLADGDLAGAVEALELGRGQVLHASTTTTDVPALLREAGRADLAGQWEGGPRPDVTGGGGLGALLEGSGTLLGALGEGADPPLPDDLRQRALTALAGSRAGVALMTPPTAGEIAATLRTAGAHALVYLLPPGAGRSGAAVVVTREGHVDTVELGLLRHHSMDALRTYREAHAHRQSVLERGLPDDDPGHAAAHTRWRAALEELCDWAGPVVMGPLCRSAPISAAGPEPHLVLVPFGDLGGVPWHAAVLSSGLRHGGRAVRAVERLTLSYAASARQLTEVAGRPRLPPAARPVIVGNPDDSLPGASAEAGQIRRHLYGDGLLLGKVRGAAGPGTPAEVLSALPGRDGTGASVLHLACHALPSGSSPLEACLLLAADEEEGRGRLSVREILRQARGRPPGAPGGLVVLDACVSDHTAGDFDEALTLSTAFLAAGATGVIGSRWEVPDGMTGLLMYVFHDRLRAGATPVRALREAQLWLLDPDRELSGLPRRVADLVHDGDPAALELWAAFACQGH